MSIVSYVQALQGTSGCLLRQHDPGRTSSHNTHITFLRGTVHICGYNAVGLGDCHVGRKSSDGFESVRKYVVTTRLIMAKS